MQNFETKFNVGEKVLVSKSNENGIIKDVNLFGNGDNVYTVSVDGVERLYVESYLEKIEEENNDVDSKVMEEIESTIEEIIKEANLIKAEDKMGQLTNACRLHLYLTMRSSYFEDDKLINTNNVQINELYKGLVNGETSFISSSFMFSEILKRVGMDVLNVCLKDEDGNFYLANLVLIGDKYFYFDVNMEQEIIKEEAEEGKEPEYILVSAGLGSKEYCQFFEPLCILDFNNGDSKTSLPSNISEDSIDPEIVNKLAD